MTQPLTPRVQALEDRMKAVEAVLSQGEAQRTLIVGNDMSLSPALAALVTAIQQDYKVAQRYLALARRMQGSTNGLLTDLVHEILQQGASHAPEAEPSEAETAS